MCTASGTMVAQPSWLWACSSFTHSLSKSQHWGGARSSTDTVDLHSSIHTADVNYSLRIKDTRWHGVDFHLVCHITVTLSITDIDLSEVTSLIPPNHQRAHSYKTAGRSPAIKKQSSDDHVPSSASVYTPVLIVPDTPERYTLCTGGQRGAWHLDVETSVWAVTALTFVLLCESTWWSVRVTADFTFTHCPINNQIISMRMISWNWCAARHLWALITLSHPQHKPSLHCW